MGRRRSYYSSRSNTSRSDIIDDLLKARPAGPEGCNAIAYKQQKVQIGHNDHGVPQYRELYIPVEHRMRFYGYTMEQLYNLNLHSEYDCIKYISERVDAPTTITRRSRLLWTRIKGAVAEFKAAGGQKGVYKLNVGWRTLAYVLANSTEEARQIGQTSLGYTIDSDTKFTAEFTNEITQSALIKLNADIAKNLSEEIVHNNNRIQNYKEENERYAARITAINMLQNQQIAIDAINAMDKLAAKK